MACGAHGTIRPNLPIVSFNGTSGGRPSLSLNSCAIALRNSLVVIAFEKKGVTEGVSLGVAVGELLGVLQVFVISTFLVVGLFRNFSTGDVLGVGIQP